MRVFLFFALLLTACEKPLSLRPPYILPELHHWPKPYKGVTGLQLHVFKTGEISAPKRLVYRGGSPLETTTLDVLVFVVEHPRRGLLLIGTGLNKQMAERADRYLGALHSALGSPTMAKGQDIVSQLKNASLSAEKVRQIVLPDLRFTHTGELESFPLAQAIVSSAEYTAATEEDGDTLSLSNEYDKVKNWKFIDFVGAGPLGTFRAHRDLFGDGSVLLIDVTGATAGGLAVLVRLPQAPVLLCGNLAWTTDHAQYAREPGILFNRQAWWEAVWRLKKFAELAPALVVLPNHDWSIATAAKRKEVILHPFPPLPPPEVKRTEKKPPQRKSLHKRGDSRKKPARANQLKKPAAPTARSRATQTPAKPARR